MDYEAMLEQGLEKLPEKSDAGARFEIPNVRGHIEGNKTIVTNFTAIANHLQRPPQHLLKYVLKELATPGEFRKQAVIFGRKVPASRINEKIQQYGDDFVICRECGKPDTKLSKDSGIYFLRCQACGAKYSIASKI